MKKITKMISLDTSSKASGWAYWENGILTRYGELNHEDEKDAEARLDFMCRDLISSLKETKPLIIVVEMTVVPNNAHTQRILTEIVGVVRGYAYIHNSEFFRFRPTQWRKLVKDENEVLPKKRKELKQWSINKVKKIYGIDVTDNIADAILMGLARINMFKDFK